MVGVDLYTVNTPAISAALDLNPEPLTLHSTP